MYQALYRKYRPQTFDDVVGQRSVTETLKGQLVTGRLSHAYLFTGTRGTGKTSCAKILAKAVNCLQPIDGNPCNCCAMCKAIDAGACTDVQEIDAASNNGVDNVRALRDEAVYSPAEGKKRVYIIDEVHMLSMSAFNALLKTIEEPPEHLLFILATTELHKVPATILSRCQRFSFRRLLPEDIASRISYVAYQEQIPIDDDAVQLLSHLADGALRDGMSLLDQCASASRDTVTPQSIYRCLGLAGQQKTAQLLECVSRQDVKGALGLFNQLYAEGKDLAAMMDELTSLARDLLIIKTAPQSGLSMLSGVTESAQIMALQGQFTGPELLRIITLLQQTTANFSKSPNRRIDSELCLIQMCQPELQMDAKAFHARLSRMEEQLRSGSFVLQQPTAAETVPQTIAQEPEQTVAPETAKETEEADDMSDSFWPELVQRMRAELRPPVQGFFDNGPNAPLRAKLSGDTLLVVAADPFVKGMVDKPHVLQMLRMKAAAVLGRNVAVKIVIKGQEVRTHEQSMQDLIDFGNNHKDIFTIHQ